MSDEKGTVEKPAEMVEDEKNIEMSRQLAIKLCNKYHMTDEDKAALYGSLATIVTLKLKRKLFTARVHNRVLNGIFGGTKK